MKTSIGLLLSLVWITAWGADHGFFRVGCLEGGAPENVAISSTQSGGIFLEFDTEDQYTYIIQATSHLIPSPAWTTVLSFTGDSQRIRWQMPRWWSATFGASDHDRAYSAQQTSDGGYIVAGGTLAGEADGYLIKTDENGSEIWIRTLGGSGSDRAAAIRQTSEGGYIVAGETYSFGAGAGDVYLIKTDRHGYAPLPDTTQIPGGDRRHPPRSLRGSGGDAHADPIFSGGVPPKRTSLYPAEGLSHAERIS